jgi:hypothetical protein
MSASTGTSISGHQTGAPVARHGRHGADVVEVGVGEEDRVDLDAELFDRREDPLGLVAWVDDDRVIGALGPGDEAVLGHLADGQHRHLELAHSASSLGSGFGSGSGAGFGLVSSRSLRLYMKLST